MRQIGRLIIMCITALLLACAPSPRFQGVDLGGQSVGGDFQLRDAQGKLRSLAEFRGKVVALFFGYTQCPDVCPTTLAEMRVVMAQLGQQSADLQVLFVSVDPARDTPALLGQYVPAFHPAFIGLTGSAEQVATVAGLYKVFYEKRGSGESYTVDHTAGTYLIDRQGKARVLVNYGSDPGVFLHDIRLLMQE